MSFPKPATPPPAARSDDDDEDEEGYRKNVQNSDSDEASEDDDDSDGVEASDRRGLKGADDDMEVDNADSAQISVHDIDAHWLQRQLSKYYTDANMSAKLAEEVLEILKVDDGRACENELVLLLDF